MFRTGDRIGPYVLKERIGKGAFGIVWLAEETTLLTSHKFALKLPNEDHVDVEAIRQEASVWEQVKGHPNILPIIKADIVDNQIYIASEYAPDGTLSDWLRQHSGKTPSANAALEMAKGILAGLKHLHSKQVIHRDLKPDNILLQGEIPRIADFGIARVLKESHSSQISGTPSYMAPEGFKGIRSEQSDIWAAGIIIYQLLTGLLPFPQSDLASLMNAIIFGMPQIDERGIPKQLLSVIKKALEKDLKKRYQSASQMRDDLRRIHLEDTESISHAAEFASTQKATDKFEQHFSEISQNNLERENTLSTGLMQITAEDKQETQPLEIANTTAFFASKNKMLKWGGLALAMVSILAVASYKINFSSNSVIAQETTDKGQTPDNKAFLNSDGIVSNKTKWAEWALMLETNEYDKIIQETAKEIERDPGNFVAYRMRATAYYSLNKDELGRMDVREVMRLTENPTVAEAYESRCYALAMLSKFDEGLKHCTKAIELDSDMALAYNIRGTVYHQKQMYDLAIAEYNEAIKRSPRASFFRNRAITYEAIGKKSLAIADNKTADNLEKMSASKSVEEINNSQLLRTPHRDSEKPQPDTEKLPIQPKPIKSPKPKKVTVDDVIN